MWHYKPDKKDFEHDKLLDEIIYIVNLKGVVCQWEDCNNNAEHQICNYKVCSDCAHEVQDYYRYENNIQMLTQQYINACATV